MDTPHLVPTDATDAGALARQLAALVGPAVQAPDGSIAAQEYLALATALQTARQTTINALAEAFVDAATNLLSEHEAEYGLPIRSDLSADTRRAALTARARAYAGTAQRITTAIGAILGTTSVTETTLAGTASPRDVFRIGITMTSTQYADPVIVAQVLTQLDLMAPAHLNWCLGNQVGFKCDDASSLTDLTLLGS